MPQVRTISSSGVHINQVKKEIGLSNGESEGYLVKVSST